jgi:hypothetical protein
VSVGQIGALCCMGIGLTLALTAAWMHRDHDSRKPQYEDDIFNGWMLGIGFTVIITGALMLVGLR